MTLNGQPIKLRVLGILDILDDLGFRKAASVNDINELMPNVKRDNLCRCLYRLKRQEAVERVNPGVCPAQYQISDKGKEEYRDYGRRR